MIPARDDVAFARLRRDDTWKDRGLADEHQIEIVLERYAKVLRAAIVRTVPEHPGLDFEDIEQEARIRVWKALEAERPTRRLDSYIYRIGVTTAIDAVRKARARREEQLGDLSEGDGSGPMAAPPTWPETVTRRREAVATVRGCLEQLAANRRRAVGLRLHGLTRGEIAELTGWTEAKIRNLVHRGLKELRACCRVAGIDVPEVW